MITDPNRVFHARARYEAARYGADAWVFVRELLQNARDAGAARVWFDVSTSGGLDRIGCRDDGSGMTFSHARRFLFTLYASSKRGGPQSAGRFGIGFWSILRFSPSAITIRSRSLDDNAWTLRLDGDLNVVQRGSAPMDPGTDVVIERDASGEDIEGLLRAAVIRDAPFLTRRGDADSRVEVRINGNLVRAAFDLPPPSLRFRRRGLRGVVGLGSEPRVEVFVHGLRVRDAASLDDLLLTGRRGRAALPAVTEGLAPQALMDSSGLTVLLARGDAREDRSLRRVVAVGHREIRRLVRAELDRHARPSRATLLAERVRDLWSTSRTILVACVGVLVVLGGVAGWKYSAGLRNGPLEAGADASAEQTRAYSTDLPQPYADLGTLYRGPTADVLGSASRAVDLGYRPADERPLFAALLITGIDAAGAPMYPLPSGAAPTRGSPCVDSCLEVEMTVASEAGLLRLPVATGHVVDATSVTLNGQPIALIAAPGGLPVVDLGGRRGGRLAYRSAVGAGLPTRGGGTWPRLPPEAAAACAEITKLPADARAGAAADWVRRRVVYDASPTTSRRHRAEQRRGRGLFERSLLVGAGDCDVQNAMVAAMLDTVDIHSRLAVGWVGEAGRTRPGLHAWVEFLGSDGQWRVVDASVARDRAAPVAAVNRGAVKPGERGTLGGWWVLPGAGLVLLLAGAGLWFGRTSPQRVINLAGRDGTAGLVRAAAVHPGSFGNIHALYHRKLVPVLGERSVSMARALVVAASGKLAVGGRECSLARRAAVRGTVIDRDTSVGAAAADALGAVDLDDWQKIVSRSWIDPVASRVEDVLVAAGEPYLLRIAHGVGEDVSVLDGARVGLSAGERWIVLDQASDVWRRAHDVAHRRPAAAALVLALAVIDRIGLPQVIQDDCLAGLARSALHERDGGPS